MPRMTGSRAAKFPDEIQYRGLTPLVTSVNVVSESVSDLEDTVDTGNEELSRIRRANELIIGQDVEDGD